MKLTTALKNYCNDTGSMKAALDGGRLFAFSGAEPETADAALDMVAEHTELVEMTEDGDGATGLTFGTSVNGALPKTTAEIWKGLIDFDGLVAGPGTQTPTFLRFCEAGDNGRGLATTQKRVQMSCGPIGQEIYFPDMVDNGSNEQGCALFELRFVDLDL